jgi:hypothetical protein
MRNLAVIILLVLGFSSLQAREVAGVDLPENAVLEKGMVPLVLNGTGIRKKFFFSIYVASLYLPSKSDDPVMILESNHPNRVRMDMLYSEVGKDKLVDGWNEGFESNQSAEALVPLQERIERFNGMFETLVAGDQVQLDYLPGQGTRVSINGSERGVIPGHDFNQALLKIWIGESPVTSSVKRGLLGGG